MILFIPNVLFKRSMTNILFKLMPKCSFYIMLRAYPERGPRGPRLIFVLEVFLVPKP